MPASPNRRGIPVWGRWALLATALITGAVLVLVGGEIGGDAPRQLTADRAAGGTEDESASTDLPSGAAPTSGPPRPAASPPTNQAPAATAAGRPMRVTVPSLDIDAPVVPLETDGRVLVPPTDPTTAGWWRDGAAPGSSVGAAIVTGHTVSSGGGVFDDLDRLRPGDAVGVTTTHGRLDYVVEKSVTIRQGRLAERAPRLFSQSGRGRLVLVTCEDWNGDIYLSNQVVVALPA
jgi:LPXTG-site transpeptidase (sortase) family protein